MLALCLINLYESYNLKHQEKRSIYLEDNLKEKRKRLLQKDLIIKAD